MVFRVLAADLQRGPALSPAPCPQFHLSAPLGPSQGASAFEDRLALLSWCQADTVRQVLLTHPHFADKETEAQNSWVSQPSSCS